MRKRIPVERLRVGMHVDELCGSWLDHPFWSSSLFVADERVLRELRSGAIRECWIDTSKGVDVDAAVVPSSDGAAADADGASGRGPGDEAGRGTVPHCVPLAEELDRAASLAIRAKDAVTSLFQQVRLGKALEAERCAPLVDEIAQSARRHPGAFVSLARLKSRDDYTFLHSVAVCALMVSLARALGHDEDRVRAAGLAGLLHDIGKATVPLDLLQKPGKLDESEYALLRLHPERGHVLLVEGGESDAAVLDVCLHHHERIDGQGYPHRIAGDGISLEARMGAVCDVYDAITSNRPYKAGWDPAASLARMVQWSGHFDPAVLQAFIRTLGIYPVGSLVRMKSGRLAVVVESNEAKPLLPKVRAFFSTKSGLPVTPHDIDLAARSCADAIVGREPRGDWNFKHLEELWAGRETLRRLGKL